MFEGLAGAYAILSDSTFFCGLREAFQERFIGGGRPLAQETARFAGMPRQS